MVTFAMPRVASLIASTLLLLSALAAVPFVVAPRAADQMPQHVKARLAAMGTTLSPETIRTTLLLYAALAHASPKGGVTVAKAVSFGPDRLQTLDVYRAEGRVGAPIVVFFHGGGFIGGDKDSNAEIYANVATYFARNGMLGVNANYRLAPAAPWPAGAQDVGAVVAWLKDHATKYGGDPARIVLLGHSAGATHVASYAFDPSLFPAGGPGIAGVVLLSGLYRVMAEPPLNLKAYFGDDPALYAARSPITHAKATKIPAFLVVAELDPVFLATPSLELMQVLCERDGRCPRFAWLAHHNHISTAAHLNTGDEVLGPQILDFVRAGR
jgi:acetyl esterase